VYPIGRGGDEGLEEGRGGNASGFVDQLDESELAGAVDGHKQIGLAFGGLHFGDADVGEARPATGSRDVPGADGACLELGLGLLVARDVGQAGVAVASRQRCRAERVSCEMVACRA
jgi:hypothetical protein